MQVANWSSTKVLLNPAVFVHLNPSVLPLTKQHKTIIPYHPIQQQPLNHRSGRENIPSTKPEAKPSYLFSLVVIIHNICSKRVLLMINLLWCRAYCHGKQTNRIKYTNISYKKSFFQGSFASRFLIFRPSRFLRSSALWRRRLSSYSSSSLSIQKITLDFCTRLCRSLTVHKVMSENYSSTPLYYSIIFCGVLLLYLCVIYISIAWFREDFSE